MKKSILFILFLIFGLTGLIAQTTSAKKSTVLSESAPESVGISSERLARVDSLCAMAVEKGDLPGIVVLIARNGKIVLWKAYGMADNATEKILKRDDIFRIASQSKAITSTAVMMLWEEGKFQLDDPISKYIPEFKNPQVLETFKYSDTTWTTHPAKSEITIRQLLTHTSGLGYGMIDADERMKMIYQKENAVYLFTTEKIEIGEMVKKLARLPLHHNPGEKYTYSYGIDVLGYLIEVVSGISLDEFLKTRIFVPLGMDDTHFYQPDNMVGRVVSVQQKNKDGKWEKYPVTFYDTDFPVEGAKSFFSGGGGLTSTAKDYATFLQMYLNGGEYNGIRLLSRTTIETVMSNQIDTFWNQTPEKTYGLAFSLVTPQGVEKGGIGSLGTFFGGGYFNSRYFADPKEKTIGIILRQTQGSVPKDTDWQFFQLAGQAIDD